MANAIVEKVISELCPCECHTAQNPSRRTLVHFFPCCEGRCGKCSHWFKTGLNEHEASCTGVLADIDKRGASDG